MQIWLKAFNGTELIDLSSIGSMEAQQDQTTQQWHWALVSQDRAIAYYLSSTSYPDSNSALAAGLLALILELP